MYDFTLGRTTLYSCFKAISLFPVIIALIISFFSVTAVLCRQCQMKVVNTFVENYLKRLTKTYQLVVMSLLLSTSVFGQISNSFTALYRDYFIHQNIVNPADYVDRVALDGSLHHKSFIGPLSVIKTYLGNANYQFTPSSGIGLQFSSEQEGKFFNRDRLYLMYRSGVKIDKSTNLKAGLKLGLVNYSFGASSGSAGGSNSALDVVVGGVYQSKKLMIGLSGHQLPNVKVKPIDYSFDLPRYLELISNYWIQLGADLNYFPGIRIRYAGSLDQSVLMHSHIFKNYRRGWQMGIHHLWGLGISPTVGYDAQIRSARINFAFSYFIRLSNSVRTNQLTNQYEFGVSYTKARVIRDAFKLNWR